MTSGIWQMWQKLFLFGRPPRSSASSDHKILWIHAGGHKTGSTAIQNYLTLGGLQTTAPHIFYCRISGVEDPKYLNTGNGQVLWSLLKSKNGKKLGPALKKFIGTGKEAIVSSEKLSFISSEEWQRLDAAAAANGIRVRVVFFVRDPLPFLVSLYDQLIKDGKVCAEFKTWAKQAEWIHAKTLRRLAQSFPHERLRVRHYDSEKHQLFSAFFQALGIQSPELSPLAKQIGILNRSLTHSERDLLKWINQTHPSPFFRELLNAGLQRAEPVVKTEAPKIPRELAEVLHLKFSGEADWINRTFFGGRSVVGSGSVVDQNFTALPPDDQAAQSIAVYRRALSLVLERADLHARILQRVKTVDWNNMTDPCVPHDFDPVGYLVCNPDLIFSEIPLVQHFLQHGRREGRRFRC